MMDLVSTIFFCILYLVAAASGQVLEELLENLSGPVGGVAKAEQLIGCLLALVDVHHDVHLAIQRLGQALSVPELSLLRLK